MNPSTTLGEIIAQAITGTGSNAASSVGPTVGTAVLIRTVTHFHTGRITAIDSDWIVLDDAAWIADTGRFSASLTSGVLAEVEPFPGAVWVNRGAVIDMTVWTHPLPMAPK